MATLAEKRKKLERLKAMDDAPSLPESGLSTEKVKRLERLKSQTQESPQTPTSIMEVPDQPANLNLGESPVMEVPVDKGGKPMLTDKGTLNSMKEALARIGTQLSFGIPGGIAGSAGGPLGSILGFGAGAFGGEGVFQSLQHLGLAPGEAPKTSTQALNQMSEAGVDSVTGDVIFRGLGRVKDVGGNIIRSRFKDEVAPVVRETRDIFRIKPLTKKGKKLQEEGVGFTLGQTLDDTAVDTAEDMVASTWTGAKKIQKLADRTEDFLDIEMRSYIDSLKTGLGADDYGRLAQSAIENNIAHKTLIANGLYKKLGNKLASGGLIRDQFGAPFNTAEFVSTSSLKKQAGEFLGRGGIASDESLRASKIIMDLPDRISFQRAANIRSDLLAITRTGSDQTGTITTGMAKKLSGVIDDSMEQSFETVMKGIPDSEAKKELNAIWRSANKVTSQKKELFNSKFIKALAESDPDQLLDKLMRSVNADDVERAKAAIGDKELWRQMQGGFLDRLLIRGTRSIGGREVIAGDSIARDIFKMKDSVKKAFFTDNPEAFNNFEKMVKALARAQTKTRGTGGQMLARFQQARSAGNVLSGQTFGNKVMLVGDTVLLFGPGQFARMFSSQKIVNGIIDGFKPSQSLQKKLSYAGRMIGLLNQDSIKYDIMNIADFNKMQQGQRRPQFDSIVLNQRRAKKKEQKEQPFNDNLGPVLLGR